MGEGFGIVLSLGRFYWVLIGLLSCVFVLGDFEFVLVRVI